VWARFDEERPAPSNSGRRWPQDLQPELSRDSHDLIYIVVAQAALGNHLEETL